MRAERGNLVLLFQLCLFNQPGLLHFVRNDENLTGDARGGAPAEPNKVSEEGANRTAGPGQLVRIITSMPLNSYAIIVRDDIAR